MNVKFGKIFYVILDSKVDRPFQEFLITIDEDERATLLEKLESDAVELTHAILKRDTSVVSHIADDENYLGRNGNWMCNRCPFYQSCLAIKISAGEQIKASDEVGVKRKSKSIDSLITEIKCRQ